MSHALRWFPVSAALLLVATALAPRPAAAQELGLRAYGIRAGLALEDDLTQILVGGHADLGRPAPNLRLQPLFTVGAGEDALTLLLGGEVHYLFPIEAGSTVEPYVGGGLGVHHIDFDEGSDTTDLALLVAGGVDVPVERWWGWFAEGRFVIEDETIFRLEAGVNWQY
ncbi:MAG: hypothetical protein KY397_01540 [Gemmatimonadetes bacterium]|nr:hypothetical protein [Gemmatimonadota bacterium]